MSIIAPTPIADIPTPAPQRGDRTTFSARVDGFVSWLISAVAQFNLLASNVYTNAVAAFGAAESAAVSANSASGSASTCSGAVIASSESASSAASHLESIEVLDLAFNSKFLGSKASDPTTDNLGQPLVEGAFYINYSTKAVRFYLGTDGWVQGIASVAGVSSVNLAVGAVSLKSVAGIPLTGTGDIPIPVPAGSTIYLANNFGAL